MIFIIYHLANRHQLESVLEEQYCHVHVNHPLGTFVLQVLHYADRQTDFQSDTKIQVV